MKLFYISPRQSDVSFNSKFSIIQKKCRELNIELLSGVELSDGLFDGEETLGLINKSNYYLADLSFERPSCYYEVGYVQGKLKNGFLIAESATVIHQVSGKVIFYKGLAEYDKLVDLFLEEIVLAQK